MRMRIEKRRSCSEAKPSTRDQGPSEASETHQLPQQLLLLARPVGHVDVAIGGLDLGGELGVLVKGHLVVLKDLGLEVARHERRARRLWGGGGGWAGDGSVGGGNSRALLLASTGVVLYGRLAKVGPAVCSGPRVVALLSGG